ncbi:quinon protein alcohol dehydrogenase-like superfamily [Rhizoctonia solani]|nr:quinon protein alcohol dehydrogenase-like superfamily [Rhizoctonia solani]
MSSQHPSDKQGKRGVRQALRSSVQRLKDGIKRSSGSRPQSGQTGVLTPGSGTGSHTVAPAPSLGVQLPESRRATPTPPPGPSAEPEVTDPSANVGEKQNDKGNVAWSRLTSSLRVLETSVELFPPLQSAVGGLIGCLDVVQVAASNRTDYEELVDELRSMADILGQHAGVLDSEKGNGSVTNIVQCILAHVQDIEQQKKRGTLGRLRGATNEQEDVMRRYRQIEKLFRQLQCDVTMRTQDHVKKQLETTLLRGMSPVDDARYNSSYSMAIKRHGCTAETRETIHQTLADWATDPTSARVYWMSGMAGTGKTTIAYSFCEWLERTNRLGASFFCSRISATCRSLARIVPTVAYQLARYSSAFRTSLCIALSENPDAGSLNVGQQFEKLVHHPILEAEAAIPDGVVIVIDALDESDDPYSVHLLLDTLLKHAEHIPVKFFVSSRPDYVIRDRMMSQEGTSRSVFHLHDIEQSIVEEDIRKYLTESLSSMSPPPSPQQIEALAERAGMLFIYAATVVRYIHPKVIPVNSGARLEAMLKSMRTVEGKVDNKYKELDLLYATVLEAAFNEDLDTDENECIQRVLWAAVCAREPMTATTIAILVNTSEAQVWASLQSLRSVLHVPEDSGPISVLHASFPEYMLDKSRSKGFHCDESKSNEILALHCFRVMKSELRFNICQLTSSYLTDDQVEDLDTRVAQYISPTLSYACRHWGNHLLVAPALDSTRDTLIDFLSDCLLFWMEVQTWLRRMNNSQDEAMKQLTDTRHFMAWFATNPCSQSTPHIYISALSFCRSSSWVSQHYRRRTKGLANNLLHEQNHAALSVWNTRSWTIAISPDGDRIAASGLDGEIDIYDAQSGRIVAGPFQGPSDAIYSIGSIAGSLRGHTDVVHTVAFSPCGTRIHRSWALIGHTGHIGSVKFSPDGHIIASAASRDDNSIRLWNAHTGVLTSEPLKGHEDGLTQLAFSPNGKLIASGSDDKTVRVWDVQTGKVVCPPFEGHTHQVLSLVFSPNGDYIASGGGDRDRSIILWEVSTGSVVAGPFYGHTLWVGSLAFSPDGTRLYSSSMDYTIRIWDVQVQKDTANQAATYVPSVGPIAFSPDRSQFISSSMDGLLHIWDLHTGTILSPPFEGQTEFDSIDSVAFSPTGNHVAAATSDCAVRVWDVATGSTTFQPLRRHQAPVRCVVFSPDGAYLCSGSDDFTIVIWDMDAGVMVGEPCNGHAGPVRSVAYSPDGTYVASCATDHIVQVWDPAAGVLIYSLSAHNNSEPSKDGRYDAGNWVCYSPDGTYIAVGDRQAIRLFDAQTTELLSSECTPYSEEFCWVGFSPDGTNLISVSTPWTRADKPGMNTVRVWRAKDTWWAASQRLEIWSFVDAPDGRILSDDGLVIWVPPELFRYLAFRHGGNTSRNEEGGRSARVRMGPDLGWNYRPRI